MNRTTIFLFLLIFFSSSLGCGFALRGGDAISSRFTILELDLTQPNSETSRLLRQRLSVSDVSTKYVSGSDENSLSSQLPRLIIRNEQVTSRPVTINPRARAAQYEMRISITISLEQSRQMLIQTETLSVDRTYFEDIENITGNREEVEIIATEMRRELVNQIIRRLEAISS
tara:strand:- start:1054 stop:1569 length:516 start_codon:yes stop_codon:yes gene_type:complete